MEPAFVVAYDILDEGVGVVRPLLIVGWLAGIGIGGTLLARAVRRYLSTGRTRDAVREMNKEQREAYQRLTVNVAVGICAMLMWVVVLGLGFGNFLLQRWQCLAWAENGDYQVVEGDVRDFRLRSLVRKSGEAFTVSGVHFGYDDNDLTQGAFNHTMSHGGPIRAGLYVRIAHHDGRILRIEVRR